ncbi:hypothetical protein QBC40DRAFT_277386 [Triangularia verruculosa]|uniref:Uncharacterized protein n=1 Tax=Triangularia verruculosa TaxID=2587418 RepID=A0AAN6XJR3_9PEZI|nr:hypothetical protein QBC40DRAFT_277386 [Triangularia verruculosa]
MARQWPVDGDNSDIPHGYKRIEYDADARMYTYQKGNQLYVARSNTSPMTPVPRRAASNISPEGFRQGFPNANRGEHKNGLGQGIKRRVTVLTRSITRHVTGRRGNTSEKQNRAALSSAQTWRSSLQDEKPGLFEEYDSDEDERPATTFDEIFAKARRMNTM